MRRAYLPLTLGLLGAAREAGVLGGIERSVHVVSPALRAEVPGADEEVLEYLALGQAGFASLQLLDPTGPPRRVVAAVNVASVLEVPDAGDPTLARLRGPVAWADLAAVHLDAPGAEPAVRDALAAIGTPGEEAATEALAEHELGWYAVQELDDLLGSR